MRLGTRSRFTLTTNLPTLTAWPCVTFLTSAVVLGSVYCRVAVAQEGSPVPGADRIVRLSDGRIRLTAPSSWQARRPQTRIVEYEFHAPAAGENQPGARITIMGAGGGVEANIARWIDQFDQPDGSPTKEKTKVEKQQKNGAELFVVSISGTYKDRPAGGPFTNAPVVPRPRYRMLSAIVVTPNLGHYYIKMVGPENVVTAHEEAFRKMLETLEIQTP